MTTFIPWNRVGPAFCKHRWKKWTDSHRLTTITKKITEKKWFHEINVVILVFEDAKTSFWILVNLYKGKEVSNVDSEKCQEWPQGFLLCQHWSVEFPNSLPCLTLLNTRMRSQQTKRFANPWEGMPPLTSIVLCCHYCSIMGFLSWKDSRDESWPLFCPDTATALQFWPFLWGTAGRGRKVVSLGENTPFAGPRVHPWHPQPMISTTNRKKAQACL